MFIGGNFFSLHEICSKSDYMVKDLMNKNRRTGQIMISAKEMKFLNSVITLQWEFLPGENIKAGYYFLKLTRGPTQENIPIYQTESTISPYSKK